MAMKDAHGIHKWLSLAITFAITLWVRLPATVVKEAVSVDSLKTTQEVHSSIFNLGIHIHEYVQQTNI